MTDLERRVSALEARVDDLTRPGCLVMLEGDSELGEHDGHADPAEGDPAD